MAEVDLILLLAAALFAGFVDAVAGGGGLIQVPTLLMALPAESPATVFGTNKVASIFGTAAWIATYIARTLRFMLKSQSFGVQSRIEPWCT